MQAVLIILCAMTISGMEPENVTQKAPIETINHIITSSNSLGEAVQLFNKMRLGNKALRTTLQSDDSINQFVEVSSKKFGFDMYAPFINFALTANPNDEKFIHYFHHLSDVQKDELIQRVITNTHNEEDALIAGKFLTVLYKQQYLLQFNTSTKTLRNGDKITVSFYETRTMRLGNSYYRVNSTGKIDKDKYIGTKPVQDGEIPNGPFEPITSYQSIKPCKKNAIAGNSYQANNLIGFWLIYPCAGNPIIVFGIFDTVTESLRSYKVSV